MTLQQFAHSIGITLYEGMWMSRAYSMKYPAPIKENMYFAIETFAGHPYLEQTARLEENVLVTARRPRRLHAHGAHGRGDEVGNGADYCCRGRRLRISEPRSARRAVLSAIGAELQLAADSSPEIDAEAWRRTPTPLLVTYAKINARHDPADEDGAGSSRASASASTTSTSTPPPQAGIVVTKVPDYCIDEVSDHAMALLLAAVRKIPMATDAGPRGHVEDAELSCRSTACAERARAGRVRPDSAARRAEGEGVRPARRSRFDPFVPRRRSSRRRASSSVDFAAAAEDLRLRVDSQPADAGDDAACSTPTRSRR
mgnify:CR=1 FL=1